MNSRLLIGFIMLSVHVCLTYQKAFWNEKVVYPEGLFSDYNGQLINTYYKPINSNGNIDTTPLILIPDPSFQHMNTAENKLSGPTSMIGKDINNVQPIFQLFEHSKPAKTDLKIKDNAGITGSASNVQNTPEIILPPFNTYYEPYPEFYRMQNPQFNPNYEIIEIPNQNLFLPSVENYMDPFFSQNFNPYQYLPKTKKDVANSDDDSYKVTLKSASYSKGMPEIGLNPVRGFKTNFSGDISKCDMICKCRNINLKQPTPSATPSGPYTPR